MEQELELSAVIGFQGKSPSPPKGASPLSKETNPLRVGKVTSGLILHPDNEHIIYPLGTTIVVRHIISRTQQFLRVRLPPQTPPRALEKGLHGAPRGSNDLMSNVFFC